MRKLKDGKIYDTEKSIKLATDFVSGGLNDRYDELYRTKKGNFFLVHYTRYQGECSYIEPVSEKEAIEAYTSMYDTILGIEEAFPSVEFEEA